ncbi:hypothetical protein E1B28_001253 [Marasmius oreades]|uniref:protein-tyrosine-phosphatase n=1 Tax=Marasmius oreades TaxID=181124 RepID=A0A9P7V302_9AGAR|nr:uncharacterized protein E1B28_001253 [Marasmius oreades]KAG7099400.1 hypothetical protein E1B28_001253 [Marasmius oreades]
MSASFTSRKFRSGPPAALRIDLPSQPEEIAIALGDSSATSSATSETDPSPFPTLQKPKSLRNMKNLSLNTLSARSSTLSLKIPPVPQSSGSSPLPQQPVSQVRARRPSIVSLPPSTGTTRLFRKEEDSGSPTASYADGPVQILPGIWLGSEDNARNIPMLLEQGIKSILNVAKEVASPFEPPSQQLRSTVSTPNLARASKSESTYYPPHIPSGRPGMHYLKLQWSHGQHDLVADGFPSAMEFTDAALKRGEGVLIHCQCGVSRSATLVIAIVMRAAAERSPSVPSEVWALKGMQGAYDFVKEKSKTIGPNMSLIYQLLEYEKKLGGDCGSPYSDRSSIIAAEEEEWGRQRRLLDEAESDMEGDERQSSIIMQEAQALDKAMEERIIARKASASSIGSASTGIGMGAAWRSRFGTSRKRAGSIASNGSILSEDLVEEDEEQALLGVGDDFEEDGARELSSPTNSPEEEPENVTYAPSGPKYNFTPTTARPPWPARPPPSAPVWKTSFNLPPPSTAIRSTFDLTPRPKRRPTPLGTIPPSPPIAILIEGQSDPESFKISPQGHSSSLVEDPPPIRKHVTSIGKIPRRRTESGKPAPPPLHLRNVSKVLPSPSITTPSQTLFVFPPSPTLTTRTPSTMTLTSNLQSRVPFPSVSTPRISSFRADGRTRSFIGLGVPPTPTTAFSRVDARGFVALE